MSARTRRRVSPITRSPILLLRGGTGVHGLGPSGLPSAELSATELPAAGLSTARLPAARLSAGATPQPQRELPQYARPRSAPVISAPLSAPSSTPTSGGGRGMASYAPSSSPSPIEHTGSTPAPRSIAATPEPTREGGTKIIVGTSDTLDVISRRYNVPPAEILRANGYSGPRVLQPGQQLIIPRRTAQAQPPALSPAPTTKVAAGLPSSVHVAKSGDTLMNLSRRYHISPAHLAAANNIPVTTQIKIGDKINIPGGKSTPVAAATPAPALASEARSRRPLRKLRLQRQSLLLSRPPSRRKRRDLPPRPTMFLKHSRLSKLPRRPTGCRRSDGRCVVV